MGWTIHTRPNFGWRDLDILIEHQAPGGAVSFVTNMTLTAHEAAIDQSEAAFALFRDGRARGGRDFLQAALDAAWQAGLRPSAGVEEKGALKATEKHLEDMRRLVFEQPAVVNRER